MKEAELKVIKFELSDIIVASGMGVSFCDVDKIICTSNNGYCNGNEVPAHRYQELVGCESNCNQF